MTVAMLCLREPPPGTMAQHNAVKNFIFIFVFSLLLNRVRVLVVRFGDALPFSVDLQEKKDVREVDLATPALFEDAHDGERLRLKRAIFSAGPKGERGTTA